MDPPYVIPSVLWLPSISRLSKKHILYAKLCRKVKRGVRSGPSSPLVRFIPIWAVYPSQMGSAFYSGGGGKISLICRMRLAKNNPIIKLTKATADGRSQGKRSVSGSDGIANSGFTA